MGENFPVWLVVASILLGLSLVIGGSIVLYKRLNRSDSPTAVLWLVPYIIVTLALTAAGPMTIASYYNSKYYAQMSASTYATVTSVAPGPQERINRQWFPTILITYEYTANGKTIKHNDQVAARDPNAFDHYKLNQKFMVCYNPARPEQHYGNSDEKKCGEDRLAFRAAQEEHSASVCRSG